MPEIAKHTTQDDLSYLERHVAEEDLSTSEDEKQFDQEAKYDALGIMALPNAEEERKVIRKLDLRLMPIAFFMYMLSVLDRSNLGNARLAGLDRAVGLDSSKYAFVGTIFYIAYPTMQWLLVGWKHFKPHQWCAAVVLLWGVVASSQASVTNYGQLLACRFFLGVCEAAYAPGVPLYLTYFYPRERVGFRHGIFIAAAAMANAYGGALAYGISQIKGVLAPWQILFLVEGLPTIAFAVIAWFFLPDSIADADFLNEREKFVAKHLISRSQQLDVGRSDGIRWKELSEALTDPKSFIPGFMYFSCNLSYASLPLFLPTIIKELGTFHGATANGLSAPPYVLCFFYIILVCFLSDYFKIRGPFCALSALIAAIGFIIEATATKTGPRYFATFLSVQIFACVALLLTWTANIHATESRRAGGYAILATIGQCGPVLGTNIFPDSEAPYYRKGSWISASFCLFVFVLSILLSLWLIHENKKLDAEYLEENRVASESMRPKKLRYIW